MKKFILFDFDGVVADSFYVAFDVQKEIIPGITLDEYRQAFEGNINEWAEEMDKKHGKSDTSVDFWTSYVPRIKTEVKVFAGMTDIVKKLAEKYTLVVISSTLSMPIYEFAETHGIRECFTEIFGNDVHFSKVEKIQMVFEKYGVGPGDCVFVTDTLGDMVEAEKTGVGAIGVSWGFHTHETLGRGNPFKIVDKPSELEPAIAEYFSIK